MAIVADDVDLVVGIDTHAKTHTLALISSRGEQEAVRTFPTTSKGLARALAFIQTRAGGRTVAVAMEGTCSYGAKFRRVLQHAGLDVFEVLAPGRKAASLRGKDDELDAQAAARTLLATKVTETKTPRADGDRAAAQVLAEARLALTSEKTRHTNRLTALIRTYDLGIDARRTLTATQIAQIAAWRQRHEPAWLAAIRATAIYLARQIQALSNQLKENRNQCEQLVRRLAPSLLEIVGVGPVVAVRLIAAYSHHGRIRAEAKFAALAGVNPIPASSGNTTRHRLNRHGDRQLNAAIHRIMRTRSSCDPATRSYLERRQAQGRTKKETQRCLKRYIAREIYKALTLEPGLNTV